LGKTTAAFRFDAEASVSGSYASGTHQIVGRFFNKTNAGGTNSAFIQLQASTDNEGNNPLVRLGVVSEGAGTNDGAFVIATRDGTGAFEKARVTSSGNLLIGSATNSGEKLQVTGTAKITGAVTLSSTITAGQGYFTHSDTPVRLNSSGTTLTQLDFLNGGTQKAAIWWNNSTNTFNFYSGVTALTIASTGAATFSSSVTANAGYIAGTGTLASDVSMLFKTDTGDFSLINQRASHSFGIYDNLNTRYNLNFSSTGAATFSSSVTAASFIPTSSTAPSNGMYLAAANNLNFATNGLSRFSISPTGLVTFSENARFSNLKGVTFLQTGGTLLGSIGMDSGNQVTIDNNGFFGLSVGSNYNLLGGNTGIGTSTFGTSATRTFAVLNGTAPSSSPADTFQMYSNDITAGNAAPHFRTENGAVIKLYQQDNGVAAANFIAGIGSPVTTLDAFDGYTIGQVVKALRNAGILS
jgi:hypothetical protein